MLKRFLSLFIFSLFLSIHAGTVFCADTLIDEQIITSCFPEKYCSIKKIHTSPDSKKWIIYIQDAHTNYDAQMNINNILKNMSSKNCLDIILIEGACDLVDTSSIKEYPHNKSRETVSEYLLQTSLITGFEYFSINSGLDTELFGVENANTYAKNLASLRNGITLFQQNSTILDKIASFLNTQKTTINSPELRKFIELRKLYSGNIVDAKEYCLELAQKISFDKKKYPNISNIKNINKLNKNINYALLEQEIQDSTKFLLTVLEKDKIVEFNQLNLKHKIGSITARSFYNQVIQLLKENNRPTELFTTLNSYTTLLNLYSQLDHSELLLEINRIENEFIEKYALTNREKAIFDLDAKTETLNEILSFKISREKANRFFSTKEQFTVTTFSDLINTINRNEHDLLIPDINNLIANLNTVTQFYTLALERDQILVDNSINKLDSNNMSVGALIAGGFHTQGILDNLEKANVNYVFLTPKIQHISKKNIYISRILKLNSPLDTFFENALNSLAIPRWLAKIPVGVSSSEQQAQILKSISLLLTVHTDFIASDSPNAPMDTILNTINRAISNYNSRGIEIRDIKLFPTYRVYEVSVNGSSLFYCFKNKRDPSAQTINELIVEDVQTLIARDISLGDIDLSILTEDTLSPILSDQTLALSALEEGDDAPIINWAKEHTTLSESEDNFIEINALPRSIITLSLRDDHYHMEHVRFTGDERVSEVIYSDKIQASTKPEYLWHLIQVLQESVQQETSLLPHIIINNNDYTAIVPVNNKSDFVHQVDLLITNNQPDDKSGGAVSAVSPETEDPLKLNYVKFTTSISDDESVSDEELIEKLKLFIRDKGPAERLNHIAKTSPNLRILSLLADEKLYATSSIGRTTAEELYILKGLLANPLITKDIIDKIIQRPYFFILSFREKNNKQKSDFIDTLLSHESITSEQLSQLTHSLLDLKQAIMEDNIDQYENYRFNDDHKGMVAIWSAKKGENISKINKYLEAAIRSPQINLQTTKLIKSSLTEHTRDANIYLEIARYSNSPEIIYEEIKNETYPPNIGFIMHYLQIALTENPNMDINILNYLIDTHDGEIIQSLVDTLLEKELTNISDEELENALLRIIDVSPTPVHALSTLAKSNIYISSKIYDKLIDTFKPDPGSDDLKEQQKIHILKALASCPNLTFTHVYRLYELKNIDIMMNLFANPAMNFSQLRTDITLKFLEEMKDTKYQNSINTFSSMAQNPNPMPKEIEMFLVKSDHFAVRAAIASRFHISIESIDILYKDIHPFVRGMIANNPTTPIYILEKIYDQYDDELLLDDASSFELTKSSLSAFSNTYIAELMEKETRILDLLSKNNSIIQSPLKIVKPMMNDSRFSENVMAILEQSRRIALKDYQAGNYVKAMNRMGLLVLYHDYAPFGSTFTYGNIAYKISKQEKGTEAEREKIFNLAKESYELSFNSVNNINSFVALEYLKRTGDIPGIVLDAPNHVQYILQNFHSAQPLTENSFNTINRFLNYSWDKLDYTGEKATILAIVTHILYDSVSQGFISSETGLSILTQFLYKDISSLTPDKWQAVKSNIIIQIINNSNLDRSKQNELLESPLDLAEFYLRKGPRGIVNQKTYNSFRESLLLDNIPSYLMDDVTRSVWMELNGLTQDLLFVEPHFFSLVRIITDNGDFLEYADRLRFSMNFSKDKIRDGFGDINSVIKSELGHAISHATSREYDHLVRHSAFEEFQDRSACLKFPRELEDTEQANKIVKLYTDHDNLLIQLYEAILKQIDPFIIMEKLQELDALNINSEYYVRNGLAVIDKLLEKSISNLDKRYLGEAIYILAFEDKSIASKTDEIQVLFNKIQNVKSEKKKLPWDAKVFFEGGIYITTYDQSFGQLMPPVNIVAGEIEPEKLEAAEIHFAGEWMHYLFRMRVRELLRNGSLQPSMLPVFYRSVPIFLNSYIYSTNPSIYHIANTILTLTPKDIFEPLEKRSFEQEIIPNQLSEAQTDKSKKLMPAKTAEPQKVVLNLVGNILQRLYSGDLLSFMQFADIYAKYFYEFYELYKNDAVIDLQSQNQFTKKFIEHFLLSLADIDIDLQQVAAFMLAQPETEEALLNPDTDIPSQLTESEPSNTLSLIGSEKLSPLIQEKVSNVKKLEQKIVVIDFDEILNSDKASVRTEMMNALKYNLMLQHKDVKDHLKLVFLSRTKTADQVNAILNQFFSKDQTNHFQILSEQNLARKRTTVTKYIETTYSIAKQNILFVTSSQSELNEQFLANGSISFEIPETTTNWFANVFRVFSVAFDFAENERLPQSMNISKVMPVNPNYYYFSFPQQSPFKLKQFHSESNTQSLSLTDLSGISLVMPINEKDEQPTLLRKNLYGYDLIEQAL